MCSPVVLLFCLWFPFLSSSSSFLDKDEGRLFPGALHSVWSLNMMF